MEASLSEARSLSPGSPEPLQGLASLRQQQGKDEDALQLLRQSMALWFKPAPEEPEDEEQQGEGKAAAGGGGGKKAAAAEVWRAHGLGLGLTRLALLAAACRTTHAGLRLLLLANAGAARRPAARSGPSLPAAPLPSAPPPAPSCCPHPPSRRMQRRRSWTAPTPMIRRWTWSLRRTSCPRTSSGLRPPSCCWSWTTAWRRPPRWVLNHNCLESWLAGSVPSAHSGGALGLGFGSASCGWRWTSQGMLPVHHS